jgi:hypothetical protein
MEGGCSIDAALKGCFRDRRRLACRIVRAQRRPPIDGGWPAEGVEVQDVRAPRWSNR